MSTDGQGTKCRRNIAENYNRRSRVHERYRQQADGRATAYSERSLKIQQQSKDISLCAVSMVLESVCLMIMMGGWRWCGSIDHSSDTDWIKCCTAVVVERIGGTSEEDTMEWC